MTRSRRASRRRRAAPPPAAGARCRTRSRIRSRTPRRCCRGARRPPSPRAGRRAPEPGRRARAPRPGRRGGPGRSPRRPRPHRRHRAARASARRPLAALRRRRRVTAARTSGANSSTIPRLVLASATCAVASHSVGDQLPDASPQGPARGEDRPERERRAHHVRVGRVREVVGGRDVARLGRRHLQQARELHLMLE